MEIMDGGHDKNELDQTPRRRPMLSLVGGVDCGRSHSVHNYVLEKLLSWFGLLLER